MAPASGNSPVALVIGAGLNLGVGVARAFAAKGYQVATCSRGQKDAQALGSQLHVVGNMENPSEVPDVFKQVREKLGRPSVVVYNAAALSFPPDKSDPFSLPAEALAKDMAVNVVSALAAAHEATVDFSELPTTASKTFIYTGNACNTMPIPPLLSLGMGKSATAHALHFATKVYADKGFQFYYADERQADGQPCYKGVDGPAHGDYYVHLAELKEQGPWQSTFVKGKGYVDFSAPH